MKNSLSRPNQVIRKIVLLVLTTDKTGSQSSLIADRVGLTRQISIYPFSLYTKEGGSHATSNGDLRQSYH